MNRLFILILTTLSIVLPGSYWQGSEIDEKSNSEAPLYVSADQINWLTWEQAMDSMKIEKKKLLVDIYTDWCGWCKQMDKTTFSNTEIIDYVAETYYAVKFNAEQKEPIKLKGKEYKYVKNTNRKGRGYHELALALTMGRLSYPSFVFLNEDVSVIQPIPGYKDAATFEVIMTYFGGNHHQKTPWQKYQDEYIPLIDRKALTSE